MKLSELTEISTYFDNEQGRQPISLTPEGEAYLSALREVHTLLQKTRDDSSKREVVDFVVRRYQRPRSLYWRIRAFCIKWYYKWAPPPKSLSTLEGFMLQGLTTSPRDN